MANLIQAHLDITTEFNNGNCTVPKTMRPFSCIVIDQAHEQNNSTIKSDGGAIGLTQEPDALRRWMVSGPEVMMITGEFEATIEGLQKETSTATHHHEQTKSKQVTFAQHVVKLVEVIEEMGTPFLEEISDLFKLDTRDIIDPSVAASLRQALEMGQQPYDTTERLIDQSVQISQGIKKVNQVPPQYRFLVS